MLFFLFVLPMSLIASMLSIATPVGVQSRSGSSQVYVGNLTKFLPLLLVVLDDEEDDEETAPTRQLRSRST